MFTNRNLMIVNADIRGMSGREIYALISLLEMPAEWLFPATLVFHVETTEMLHEELYTLMQHVLGRSAGSVTFRFCERCRFCNVIKLPLSEECCAASAAVSCLGWEFCRHCGVARSSDFGCPGCGPVKAGRIWH